MTFLTDVVYVLSEFKGKQAAPTHLPSLPPPWEPLTTATQEEEREEQKEHGIWGVILFVFGVTCSTEARLSATVWKFIGGTNSSPIVIPSGEQSVSPAECWRGDRLLQDDNWKESGWSSLAPVAPWDSYIETPACFGGADYGMLYLKKRLCPSGLNLTDVGIEWRLFMLSFPIVCVCVCACAHMCVVNVFGFMLSDHCPPLTNSECIFLFLL